MAETNEVIRLVCPVHGNMRVPAHSNFCPVCGKEQSESLQASQVNVEAPVAPTKKKKTIDVSPESEATNS